MAKQTIYTVGGTVQAGGGVYITRKADGELLELCREGELAFILSSRQVGKSSLMTQTAEQLRKENIRSATVDLSSIGTKVTQDQWYLGILNIIATDLNLERDIFEWWNQYAELGAAQRFFNFLRDVMLKEIDERIVLFFDEIDTTLSTDFADDFFAAVRSTYNARSTIPDFKRLSFVLVGVAAPSDLISDTKRTPFNIGRRVELNDFTLTEAMPLAQGLGKNAEQVLAWILEWTNGHPYLTQRLCAYLTNNNGTLDRETVAEAAGDIFLGEKGWEENNLQFVRDMLSSRSPDVSRVLKIYKNIRSGKKVADDERSISKAHLKLSGLVRSEKGILKVRNEIYNRVFDLRWIRENTPKNWTKITAVSFGAIASILLLVLIYDFAVGNMSSQYVDRFYGSRTTLGRLENLAKMFELQGILQNTDYDSRARELFYSLSWEEQTSIFQDSYLEAADKEKYLPGVVRGLYLTMANVEGGQDSSELLRLMENALTDVNSASQLRNEINLWLDARRATTNQDALEKYSNAIQLNPDNPATRYERAKLAIEMGQYEQALLDLEATMRLAQNVATDSSDGETVTPTKVESTNSVVPTPELLVTLSATTNPVDNPGTGAGRDTVHIPSAQPTSIATDSYQSRFYSFATMRSAVDRLIQGNLVNPDFRNSLMLAKNQGDIYSNLNNGLLPEGGVLTPAPTPAVGQITTPQPGQTILLQDDFSTDGWGTLTDSNSSVEYAGEALRVQIFKENWIIWSTPNDTNYKDVHVEVTVNSNNTDPTTAFGIMCMQQTEDWSFYYFVITPAGEYAIAKATTGETDVFLTNDDQWGTSDLIPNRVTSYRIGADCGQGRLALYVNGQQIDSVSDSTYTTGHVGVFTWSGEKANSADVTFDDFLLLSLP